MEIIGISYVKVGDITKRYGSRSQGRDGVVCGNAVAKVYKLSKCFFKWVNSEPQHIVDGTDERKLLFKSLVGKYDSLGTNTKTRGPLRLLSHHCSLALLEFRHSLRPLDSLTTTLFLDYYGYLRVYSMSTCGIHLAIAARPRNNP